MKDASRLFVYTSSPEETEELGRQLAEGLQPGTVIALTGELGSGKTTLTKGIARGLQVSDLIHSPTFTLIHEHMGRIPLYHFDLFRLGTPQEIEDLDCDRYFYGSGITVIEWAEKIPDLLPPDHLEVHISCEDSVRRFEIEATGEKSRESLARFRSAMGDMSDSMRHGETISDE